MKALLKSFVSNFPFAWQQGLKRQYFARQIRAGKFLTDEAEFDLLPSLLATGDWTIDVGANVGHYTLRLSEIVGASGRVIAFEPVPSTFELLAANVAAGEKANVTLVNAAVSESCGIVGMDIPNFANTGMINPYQAHISDSGALQVLSLPVDGFEFSGKVKLIKIDAEGHEISVLRGMTRLIARDKPTLIIEGNDADVESFLLERSYRYRQLPNSWNRIFTAAD